MPKHSSRESYNKRGYGCSCEYRRCCRYSHVIVDFVVDAVTAAIAMLAAPFENAHLPSQSFAGIFFS